MIRRAVRHLFFRWELAGAWLRLVRTRLFFPGHVTWGRSFRFGTGSVFDLEGPSAHIAIGDDVLIRRHCSIHIGPEGELILGDRAFLNNGCSIFCRGRVTVGADTLFGEGVRVYDHNHKFRDPDVPVRDQGYSVGEIRVGRNCWVGSGVILLKGADIGDHCVIGAGCVIAGAVPPHSIVRLDPAIAVTPMISVPCASRS